MIWRKWSYKGVTIYIVRKGRGNYDAHSRIGKFTGAVDSNLAINFMCWMIDKRI